MDARVFELCAPLLGKKVPRTATYMTDAANLPRYPARRPWCSDPATADGAPDRRILRMERIRQSVAIYEALIADWCSRV